MPLISTSIPNLINGVSQQAPSIRLASELEIQENAYSSVVEGLSKRQPTKHIKRLATDVLSHPLIHTINRDSTERYTVVLTNGDLKVFGMDGSAKTVTFPDGKAYLNTLTPDQIIKCLTVEDFTFILNTGVAVTLTSDVSPSPANQGIVFVKQGAYATKYDVQVDNFTVAEKITSSTSAADIQTTKIADDLSTVLASTLVDLASVTTATWVEQGAIAYHISGGFPSPDFSVAGRLVQTGAFASYTPLAGDAVYLVSGTGITVGSYVVAGINESATTIGVGGSTFPIHTADYIWLKLSPSTAHISLSAGDITTAQGFDVSHYGSTILIKRKDGSDFRLTATDSLGNNGLHAFKSQLQLFTDLPTLCVPDYLVEITGSNGTSADNYWVKFKPNNSGTSSEFDNGIWVETIASNIPYRLDPATMPHVLIRNGDGTFTFKQQAWGDRTCGDLTTNPNPSFVGGTLNDIFFFRDRLGFLSGENVILSQAGSFFAFFRSTATTTLDDDPIDIAATHTSVSILRAAIPFQEELMLFADQCQFTLHAANLLTPSTVVLDQATALLADLRARPVSFLDNIYFGFPRGSFSGLYEYFLDPQTVSKTAADVTSHVPKYLLGSITKITGCPSEATIAILADGDPTALYVYKTYWSNNQKIQSSWSRFTVEAGATILNAEFIQSTLYLVIQRADGYYLESMQFEAGVVDPSSTYVTLLDRKITEADCTSVTYNAGTDTTTWTLPYPITGTMRVAVRAGDVTYSEGMVVVLTTQSGSTLTALGDYSSTKVYIGQKYLMWSRMSEMVRRSPTGVGYNVQQVADVSGRLQLRTFTVVYDRTGAFWIEVTPQGRDVSTKVFNPLTPGVGSPGSVILESGKFRFAVLSLAHQVTIDIKSDSHLPAHFTSAEYEAMYTTRTMRS